MRYLVRDDVLQAFGRLGRQPRTEPDTPFGWRTAAPARAHVPERNALDFRAEPDFPFGDERRRPPRKFRRGRIQARFFGGGAAVRGYPISVFGGEFASARCS
jgi:hypothetical protein